MMLLGIGRCYVFKRMKSALFLLLKQNQNLPQTWQNFLYLRPKTYTEMHSKSKPTSDLTEFSLSQTQKYYWDAPKHFSELVVLTCQVCLSSKSSFCFLGIFLQSELCNRLCQTTWRILWSHLGDKEGNERLCWCRIFQDNKTVYILNVSAKTNQGLDWLNTMSPHFLIYYMVIFELKTK